MSFQKKWTRHQKFPIVEQALIHEFQIPWLAASFLASCHHGNLEKARLFLNTSLHNLHEPYLMKDMEEATLRLTEAIVKDENILIVGDYDVDGITASSCLLIFLATCHCSNFEVFIPNRFKHGYGLTSASVEEILSKQPQLVVTVDHGITAVDEIATLKRHGIETIVTDHHLPNSQNSMPDCLVVNPNRKDCTYPFKGVTGCGVAFKLLVALRRHLRQQGFWSCQKPEPNLKNYLDLVALGTLADMAPLVDENRVLVHHGLKQMNQTTRCGLQALLQKMNVQKVDTQAIAFKICPMLNAAGRMEDATLAVNVLTEENTERAKELVASLYRLNEKRKRKASQMLKIANLEAQRQQKESAFVMSSPQFHEGIIGITAAQIVEKYQKPTVVFAQAGQFLKGSGRSGGIVHLRSAFDACSEYLERFGGHRNAAGCSLHQQNFASFKSAFYETCHQMSDSQMQEPLKIFATLKLSQLSASLIESFNLLEPFGVANPEPIFAIEKPSMPLKSFGKHLCWKYRDITIIGWNMLEFHLQSGLYQPHQMLAVVPKRSTSFQSLMELRIIGYLEPSPIPR